MERDSFFGCGLHIFGTTVAWFIAAVAVDRWVLTTWRFESLPMGAAIAIACSLAVAGLALYFTSLRHLLRARAANSLCTSGPYRWVRHPLYAAGVYFFAPAVCVLFRSWVVMTTAPAMLIIALHFSKREEASLERAFGGAFRAYRARTGAMLPRG